MNGSIPVAELFLVIALALIFIAAPAIDNQAARMTVLTLGAGMVFGLILLLGSAKWAEWAFWAKTYWYLAMLVPIGLLIWTIVSANRRK